MATKYEELASELRRRIEEGDYPPGSTLPGYAEIMATYSASQATVRAALEMLQSEGLVRAVKRLGIVVREPGERRRIQRGTLITRDPQRGYIFPAASSPGEPWQTHGRPRASREPAPAAVAAALGIQAGAETMRRRRVTSPVGEPPFQLVDTWIHPDVLAEAPQAGEADTGPGGYLDRIEESGHGPLSWNEVTRARMSTREEAKLLEISASMPVLEMATTGISAKTGQPVEVSVRVIPSDRAEIVSRLQRAASARWPVEPVRSAER